MAYDDDTADARRCSHRHVDGRRCGCWAVWGDARRVCAAHGGRRDPAADPGPCRCGAYRWPHRRAGGLCRWPYVPWRVSPTPAGTHGPRDRSKLGARARALHKWLRVPRMLRPKGLRWVPWGGG